MVPRISWNMSAPVATNLSFLEINPAILNSVMAVDYNGYEDTDQFLCNQMIDCKIVRPMSITGLPNNV